MTAKETSTQLETESWRHVWRQGFAPFLSKPSLEALRDALRADDTRLIQGSTTSPPPLQCVSDWPCECACAISFCGAVEMGGLLPRGTATEQGLGHATVGMVEEFFARACYQCDQAMEEPGACRWFLNFFDETPRYEMINLFLPEVEWAIAQKEPCLHG
jgi:hypothetical protein